ncbi:hypothetical protein JHK86_001110 [Glycine max]|nr:hypothetical protein JHK86_001110 [Glycine max]
MGWKEVYDKLFPRILGYRNLPHHHGNKNPDPVNDPVQSPWHAHSDPVQECLMVNPKEESRPLFSTPLFQLLTKLRLILCNTYMYILEKHTRRHELVVKLRTFFWFLVQGLAKWWSPEVHLTGSTWSLWSAEANTASRYVLKSLNLQAERDFRSLYNLS